MNLPPHMRFKPENVFIAGITPGPNAPNMITISHIIELLVSAVSSYVQPGRQVPTFRYPLGTLIQLRVAPLIADIEAVRKAAGFMSHSAKLFCSFCELTSDHIEELDSSKWKLRSGAQVRVEAEKWRSLTTKAAREAQAKSTGVRWTPFYLLGSWNSVEHVMLGYMHNWLEGVLKHQLRNLWGIGPSKENAADMPPSDGERDVPETDAESDASGYSHTSSSLLEADVPPPSSSISGDNTPRASHFTLPSEFLEDDSDNDSDGDVEITIEPGPAPTSSHGPFQFTKLQIMMIRNAIAQVSLPTHIDRPPTNLGQARHGKLKADAYLVLFAFIFPLIIPEIWWSFPIPSYERDLLESFCHLIVSTFIVISYKSSAHDRSSFAYHYTSYRRSIQELFPNPSKPNHHYAMHYPTIMENWGPVAALNEFAGERLNGQMQRTKTNRHMRDMDFTMLRQACRRARLQALLQDGASDQDALSELSAILTDTCVEADPTFAESGLPHEHPLSDEQLSTFLATGPMLEDAPYHLILDYVQNHLQPVQSFNEIPAQPGIPVLPPNAHQLRTFTLDGRTFCDQLQHEGNSAVQFCDTHGTNRTGFIQSIWILPVEQQLQTFLLVRPHNPLPGPEFQRTPYAHYQNLKTHIYDATPSPYIIVLEPKDILSHVTTLRRPAGTYGILRQTLVVCSALNRDRK
ncbi:hypothetical protein PENSPDRAFT_678949 [Peniophora sp. CONT]|nr:hypothetical protein PENSPDRAFT_678949 [Peniophora sp. CONT]